MRLGSVICVKILKNLKHTYGETGTGLNSSTRGRKGHLENENVWTFNVVFNDDITNDEEFIYWMCSLGVCMKTQYEEFLLWCHDTPN